MLGQGLGQKSPSDEEDDDVHWEKRRRRSRQRMAVEGRRLSTCPSVKTVSSLQRLVTDAERQRGGRRDRAQGCERWIRHGS